MNCEQKQRLQQERNADETLNERELQYVKRETRRERAIKNAK